MHVKVGAARRDEAFATTIFDQPIDSGHATQTRDGSLQLTFVASGMYDKNRLKCQRPSRYRYTIVLSPDEMAILNDEQQG